MRIVAVTNQKGGSGKTTTAVNVAACLADRRQRVLLVDLDPQGNASSWLGVPPPTDRGLADVFTADARLDELVTDTPVNQLQIVPASPFLLGVERAVAGEPGAEMILRRAVEQLPDRFDWLLIDCPPSLGLLTLSAFVAADELLVPVEAHILALEGLAGLMQTVERVRERLRPELRVGGIVACRVSRTRLAREVVEQLRERFGDLVLQTVIRENIKVAEAPSWHQPITAYAPASNGAADYRAVVGELLQRSQRKRR